MNQKVTLDTLTTIFNAKPKNEIIQQSIYQAILQNIALLEPFCFQNKINEF